MVSFNPTEQGGLGADLGVIGLGLELFGGMSQAKYAKEVAGVEKDIAGNQLAQDRVRRQSMENNARRDFTQQVRVNQVARAQALTAGVGQGNQFGSGMQQALSNISGASNTNIAGISQNLQFGEQMFNLNEEQDLMKMHEADIKGKQAQARGISDIGGGFLSAAKLFMV